MAKHAKDRVKRIVKAVQKTATEMEPIIREKAPEAFGRLKKQLDVIPTETGARIRDDAPYAAAVEVGSRPHTPPLDPLIDWALVKGYARDMDDAVRIARAVQRKIAREGTAPVFYVRKTLPQLRVMLDINIRAALQASADVSPTISIGGGTGGGSSGPAASSSSGRYRKSAGLFRGRAIQVDHTGRKFVRQANGKIHYIEK